MRFRKVEQVGFRRHINLVCNLQAMKRIVVKCVHTWFPFRSILDGISELKNMYTDISLWGELKDGGVPDIFGFLIEF